MKARKLPSGMWRAQAYAFTDEDGRQHKESFTAPTKAEAEMLANEYKARRKRSLRNDLTVGDAIDGYIRAKEGVLSPSTIRGYVKMRARYFGAIERKKVRSITSEDIQVYISELAGKYSPKTVKNVYALLTPSIALYNPDIVLKVTLPAKRKKRPVSPSDDAVRLLLNNAPPSLRKCIALAMCALRRSEMCALKYEDISDGVAHIHAAIVQDKDDKWIYKPYPKTSDSDRYLKLPRAVLDIIGEGKGYIITCNPETITKRFYDLRKELGLNIRLHDLRHYFASTAAVLDIPDIYTEDFGGWQRGSAVMKKVYQNNIRSMSEYYNEKINAHLDNIIQEDAN